jgi:hypothetical protein
MYCISRKSASEDVPPQIGEVFMKRFLAIAAVSMIIGACGQAGNDSSAVAARTGEIGIPENKVFIATIKEDAGDTLAMATVKCTAKIAKVSGVEVLDILESIGAVTFQSIPEQAALVKRLSCVKAVEEDGVVSTNTGIPEIEGFIATVKADVNGDLESYTKACGEKIKRIQGVEVSSVLESIGVIVFQSIPEQTELVKKLDCVAAVEKDGVVEPFPSTRIGN